jgi:hypothetical protein
VSSFVRRFNSSSRFSSAEGRALAFMQNDVTQLLAFKVSVVGCFF